MGCPSGLCAATAAPETTPGLDNATLVGRLAMESESIDHGACCAHCSGVELDHTQPPMHPHKLLKNGSGCPLSVVAYRARKEHDQGRTVDIIPQGDRVPVLRIDGKVIDAMSEYKTGECGC